MQRIKNILMWEVLPTTALKLVGINHVNQMRNRSNQVADKEDDSRPNFHLRTFKIVLQISRLSEGSTGQIFATSSVIYQMKMWGL